MSIIILMIGENRMCDNKQFRRDSSNHKHNERFFEHGEKINERHAHFSVEPSNEKEYDIYLMTGNNNGKGSDEK